MQAKWNAVHAEYSAALPLWQRARDVFAGEDAVKAAGTRYLPRLGEQSDEDYAAYTARAAFFGAAGRTLGESVDVVFRRGPVLSLGSDEGLKRFVADCDGWGLGFAGYARRVLTEVLSVGRAGSLVWWDSGRARVSCWKAEQILDWAVGEDGALVGVTLAEGERVRVFRLVDGSCFQEVWRASEAGEWRLAERRAVRGNGDGEVVSFIPFVFHGPSHARPEVERLPLGELIAANLDHYRLDADLKHGLHFTALPTAWVTGFDRETVLRIGSSTAWVSDQPGAAAGFLEFTGAGLAHLERALEKVERRLALLGAEMLTLSLPEGKGGDEETQTSTSSPRFSGLIHVVLSLNESLSKVLQFARCGGTGELGASTASGVGIGIAMNTDLGTNVLRGEDLTAVVNAWKTGAISRETMLEALKRGEVLPDGRSVAQERALIYGKLRVESGSI